MDSKLERDTIFALASGTGRGAVALVRISGPRAYSAVRAISRGRDIPERRPVVRSLFGNMNTDRIDGALVVYMAGPGTYTGEDVVELGVHGGRAVVTAVLEELGRHPHLRPAEPGEFTRQAVENGRMDLTQAEAIADLVNAETDAQRRQALRQMDGALGQLYDGWRARLIRAAAWVEAGIDFADEEIPADAVARSRAQIAEIANEIRAHLDDGRRGEILRDGLHVAVIGPPNAGKSSLINALAQRDVAIVSDIPGTTRDILEVRLDLGGYPVILADTAGMREPEDNIEREGVRRAHARADAADLRLLLLDSASVEPLAGLGADVAGAADLVVWNKCDIADVRRDGISISARTGDGIGGLVAELTRRAGECASGEGPVVTRARYRHALERAAGALAGALATTDGSPELTAEGVRVALNELGRITGRVDLDDLLDVVFRDFCIGK